jgi:hypothetical protein
LHSPENPSVEWLRQVFGLPGVDGLLCRPTSTHFPDQVDPVFSRRSFPVTAAGQFRISFPFKELGTGFPIKPTQPLGIGEGTAGDHKILREPNLRQPQFSGRRGARQSDAGAIIVRIDSPP